jgi:hypothetical protein
MINLLILSLDDGVKGAIPIPSNILAVSTLVGHQQVLALKGSLYAVCVGEPLAIDF